MFTIRGLYFAVAAADTTARLAKNLATMPTVRAKLQDGREWLALKHYEMGMAIDKARDERERERIRRQAKIEALAKIDADWNAALEANDKRLTEAMDLHKQNKKDIKTYYTQLRKEVKEQF